MNKKLKDFIYLLEYIALLPLYYLLKLLPLPTSSWVIGKLMRVVGTFHPTKQIVIKNLQLIFPEKDEQEINRIALDSWENAGKVFGELATMCSADFKKLEPLFEVEISKEAQQIFDEGKRAIYVSAHYGNWELASQILANFDKNTAFIYRRINNPYLEEFLRKFRENYMALVVPKGDLVGVRKVLSHLKKGGSLGILADQKMREGVEIEFFGKKVMAPSTPAEFAKKFDLPIIMTKVKRVGKLKFEFSFKQVIIAGDRENEEIIREIYSIYEEWIKDAPEQWFLMHNRWGFKKRQKN